MYGCSRGEGLRDNAGPIDYLVLHIRMYFTLKAPPLCLSKPSYLAGAYP